LDLAQQEYDLDECEILHRNDNDLASRRACAQGHLTVCQVNIHAQDYLRTVEDPLVSACSNSHLAVQDINLDRFGRALEYKVIEDWLYEINLMSHLSSLNALFKAICSYGNVFCSAIVCY
jgi:capsid protein